VSYFSENSIDGTILSAMKRKEFTNNLIKHCDNNKTIRGSAGALYKKLIDFDFGINDGNETKDEWKDVTSDMNGQTFVNEWNNNGFNTFFELKICGKHRVSVS